MADGSFDYVIVGAGPAGCVLANRLSARQGSTVALLEAGGPDKAREIRIPAAFSKLFTTPYDWNYHTSAQATAAGRQMYWPRGRTLGGSTSINAQMWIRGHQADYDGWAKQVPGWSYDEVLPYFHRVERRVAAGSGDSGGAGPSGRTPGEVPVYGTDGPLYISDLRFVNPATRAFLAACAEAGLRPHTDVNSGDNTGYGITPVTQRRGRRHSAADAYLRPAARRPNLTVLTGAQAHRVEFDGDRAAGVSYRGADGGIHRLDARREVLLCAGAVNSPQILMLSGIGAADQLREVGVDVRRDLPGVGENLQDHLSSGIIMTCPQPVTMVAAESLGNVARFLLAGRGMLASNVAEGIAFTCSRPDLPAPDLEIIFAPVPFLEHGQTPVAGHGITIGVVLLQPESRGRVTLASADPDAAPVIDPGYLAVEEDLRTLIRGLRIAEGLAGAAALRAFAGPPMDPWPGKVDDERLGQYIRERSETLYHPVGTCRMGTDEMSVVDGELRVHGVTGLRVVDASVMPRINRGHTQAPVYMIAERAADLITDAG